ncbi:MAG: NAD(P)-binding protein [Aeriscardovia sp.]|nr:NAD(P)-binding protein [Aeriscardovia sp.]
MKRVAVIGAGVSGMTVARLLKNRYEVVVYEKDATPGGLIRCKRVKGNLFHTCGGHVFNSKLPHILDWFWNLFDKEQEFVKAERNSVVFMPDGCEVPYPIENHAYLLPDDMVKAIVNDLVQMAQQGNNDVSNFEEFLINRFGKTLYETYFRPYNKKIWRRSLKVVPISWLEGKLPMPTVDEIIYNNIKKVKEKSFVHSTFWYEKENGSQLIADRLAEGLDVRLSEPIEQLIYDNGKWWVGKDHELYDIVVFCGNIKSLPRIIKGVSLGQYSNQIDALESHGTTSVFCKIDKNPYSWIYLPSKEYEAHRIICTGNFAGSNNVDKNTITATVEFTDEITEDDIRMNLAKMPLHPQYITHQYNPYTYPIQDNHTRQMIKDLKEELVSSQFFFTGRFADWEYYNMDVAMDAAMKTCNQIK